MGKASAGAFTYWGGPIGLSEPNPFLGAGIYVRMTNDKGKDTR
jgi:hypothetical protein